MRYLVWVLRIVVFVLVLLFALKNTEPVSVRFYAEHSISGVPLIVVMLAAFAVGVLFALLAILPAGLRRRREIRRLRRDLLRLQEENAAPDTGPFIAPETIAPLAPL